MAQAWEQEMETAVIITAKILVSWSQAWSFLDENKQVSLFESTRLTKYSNSV